MELAIQRVAADKTVRNDTIQDLKAYNSQPLSTQAKRRTISFNESCYKKAFNLMGDDIVE